MSQLYLLKKMIQRRRDVTVLYEIILLLNSWACNYDFFLKYTHFITIKQKKIRFFMKPILKTNELKFLKIKI